jgi:hypothetical protein
MSEENFRFEGHKVTALALLDFLGVGGNVALVLLGVVGLEVTLWTFHVLQFLVIELQLQT